MGGGSLFGGVEQLLDVGPVLLELVTAVLGESVGGSWASADELLSDVDVSCSFELGHVRRDLA